MKDVIVSELAGKCSLTTTQIDTLLISNGDEELKVKVAICDRGKVSKGSFLRTLRQGQLKIERSIYDLFLLGYLGLIPSLKFGQLARTGELISKVRASEPVKSDMRQLLIAMDDFVRSFSGRDKV